MAAGVHVDHRHGLGLVDHDVAARRQPHLALQRLVDLLDQVVLLEQRQLAVVQVDQVDEVGRDVL